MNAVNKQGQPILPSTIVTQDMFPGAWIEGKWSLSEQIKKAAFYGMRIALGGLISHSPRGLNEYVSVTFECTEYVLHIDNFNAANKLAKLFEEVYLRGKGMEHPTVLLPSGASCLRYMPGLIVSGLEYMDEQATNLMDIPDHKVKMVWIRHDIGPCGYYRSMLPFRYMEREHKKDFYTESHESIAYNPLQWFDVTIMHRFPTERLLDIFQNLKNCGKYMIYEYDDDIFNIPEWNLNSGVISDAILNRARVAMNFSEMIIGSTQQLADNTERSDSFVGPNLIDINDIGEPLSCSRILNREFRGYKPVRVKGDRIEFHGPGKRLPVEAVTTENYDCIRILWTGSNTHDKDLHVYTEAVKRLVDEYGISVRFMFFGYCPTEFLQTVVSSGNSDPRLEVKEKYHHAISYVQPVPMNMYYDAIRKLDPDIAVCPLTQHVFNLSKSNLKLIEMGAFGIPCVASYIGPYLSMAGICPLIDESQKDADRINDWIAVIKTYIEDSKLRMADGVRMRAKVESEYSWNTDNKNRRKWDTIFKTIYKNLKGLPNIEERCQECPEMGCNDSKPCAGT